MPSPRSRFATGVPRFLDYVVDAVRLIGVTFFALAAYLTAESIHDLITHARPGESIPGLAITAAALIVMPLLAIAKRRTGQALGNRTLIADSAETAFCAYTSAATLAGVGLNATLGWWQADPINGFRWAPADAVMG